MHGGAGGIGSTAVQLGSQLGYRVFTTCANAEDCAYATGLGAERAINFHDEDFVEIVREAGGANLILDIIGGDYVARNIKAARRDARIVQLAFNAGSKVEINLMPIMLKRLIYTGSTLRSRPEAFKSAVAVDLRKSVWPLFAEGGLAAQTHKVFPFKDAAQAHEMMEKASHGARSCCPQQPDGYLSAPQTPTVNCFSCVTSSFGGLPGSVRTLGRRQHRPAPLWQKSP